MSTFEQVADWSPSDMIGLGVEGTSLGANRERYRRARAIIEEYEPWAHEFDEPVLLRLLIAHRGDMVAVADDPALVEQVRTYLCLDAFQVQVWQDLERTTPHPSGSHSPLGLRLTEAVNDVRERVGLRRLSMRQVAGRRLTDVIRQVTSDLALAEAR
ncbi:hypothetical protein [Luteipulveratus mongoliensis]|uniref:Uncharacterized protein n=1 Tax=Luteipulveratus mongoliensis TaxID=571913 RepID=A0A0K1JMZ9_9MICO|nr:hypothetical protein [Luteipulveratus mongoliensis]AKU17955.1 hypothetical protein VV02_22300 [Luteipulveratus mongoliensis]